MTALPSFLNLLVLNLLVLNLPVLNLLVLNLLLAFSVDLAADAGESLDFPYDPDCTCATSIIDCRVCYSFAGNKPLPRHQKTSSAKEQTSSADQNVGSTARKSSTVAKQQQPADQNVGSTAHKSSTVAKQQQPAEVPRYRNKYGDIPNPQTQMKAGRRRRNQDLRKRDPGLYRRIMVEKKAIRDEKLRALRHQQRRRLW
ncbi:hypothetical protein E8E14_008532 [Neopestalotiopsis sp. 37M]|nr:hypothetical protein E8E14_008532 [Neopestalotiopsis sp. 37M]